MKRIYDTDIAVALGSIEKAVILADIIYWCDRHREEGKCEHDGRFWMYRSLEEWRKTFPEIKRIWGKISKLEQDGWIIAGNFNDVPFDHTKWYTPSDFAISQNREIEFAKTSNLISQNREIRFHENVKSYTIDKQYITKEEKEEILKKKGPDIDRLWALYPDETYRGNRGVVSTQKCRKDRDRIAALLERYTPDQVERTIARYIDESNGQFLKNFSTFLDNFPECDETRPAVDEKHKHYQSADDYRRKNK